MQQSRGSSTEERVEVGRLVTLTQSVEREHIELLFVPRSKVDMLCRLLINAKNPSMQCDLDRGNGGILDCGEPLT